MVVGLTGQLGIVQNYVMVELKRKPEVVVILHHLVEEVDVLAKQLKYWIAIQCHAQVCIFVYSYTCIYVIMSLNLNMQVILYNIFHTLL